MTARDNPAGFDNETVLFAIVNGRGRILKVNAPLAHLMGRGREALAGAPVRDFIAAEDIKRIDAAMPRLRSEGGATVECRLVRPGHASVWITWNVKYDEVAGAWYATAPARVGDSGDSDEADRVGMRLARDLFDFGSWKYDAIEDELRLDEAGAMITGVDPADLSGGAAELLEQQDECVRQGIERVARSAASADQLVLDLEYEDGDGVARHILARGEVIRRGPGGRPEQVAGIVIDAGPGLRLDERVLHLVNHDPLTGLQNRRSAAGVLADEWNRARRRLRPLSVLMIDVDRFKEINDSVGHQAGDEVLREVATLLSDQAMRAGEVVARYGGDEFIAILPETDETGAESLAGRMKAAVAGSPLTHPISGAPITISIGAVCAVPTDERTPQALVEEADRRMYEDKRRLSQSVGHGLEDLT